MADTTALDETLLAYLRTLVAQPSVSGDEAALDAASVAIADMLRQAGFQADIHPSEGAPIVVAHRAGRSDKHILFYNHYDVVAPGPWRDWNHEPFVLAERDDTAYGRGVAGDKGNLAARLAAVASLGPPDAELPVSVSFLIEGDALQGSAHLPNLVADQAQQLQSDVVFGFGGMLDANRVPYLYAGVRGRLLVALRASGAAVPLSSDMATSIVNPAWRILWALNRIKNDSEEVLIDGFYDAVTAPSREANKLTRALQIDEAARLKAWGINQFLFGMAGATLARAETFNPTCNVSAIHTHPSGPEPAIPMSADALLDFSLVPEQRPNELMRLLRDHLEHHDLQDVAIETVKGAYPPSNVPFSSFALELLASQIEVTYGVPPQVTPLAPFSVPLHLFTAGMNVPALPLGLLQPASVIRGPNESIPLTDLRQMATLVANIINAFESFDKNS